MDLCKTRCEIVGMSEIVRTPVDDWAAKLLAERLTRIIPARSVIGGFMRPA